MIDWRRLWGGEREPAPAPLQAIGTAENLEALQQMDEDWRVLATSQLEQQLLHQYRKASAFHLRAYCAACGTRRNLLVDAESGGEINAQGWRPNWRERLQCVRCGLSNRGRLMAQLIREWALAHPGGSVYFMEQVTPIYRWARRVLKDHALTGSEYLGPAYGAGQSVKGIRHEDVERLSFETASLDLVVSNDVFEHVADPWRAFRECRRVLRDGGTMLATIPFQRHAPESRSRARLVDGRLEHVLPPEYHGNPLSEEGSLVFTDFGWDLLERLRESGFERAVFEAYASVDWGHLGGLQLVLRARC